MLIRFVLALVAVIALLWAGFRIAQTSEGGSAGRAGVQLPGTLAA